MCLSNLIRLHFYFYMQALCCLQPPAAIMGLFNNYLLLCDIAVDKFSGNEFAAIVSQNGLEGMEGP